VPAVSSCGDVGSCNFTVAASPLPTTCSSAQGWNGSGTGNQCDFYYCSYASPGDTDSASTLPGSCSTGTGITDFRIYAKAYNTANLFMYRSVDSKMYLCKSDGSACTSY